MSESLKAARERVARASVRERFEDVCDKDNMDECPACLARADEEKAKLRELQRQAIVGWVVGQGYVMNDLRERHIDALLDSEGA